MIHSPLQESVVIMDFNGSIANGFSVMSGGIPIAGLTGIPIAGLTLVYGMVYSTAAVSFELRQGINDRTGAFLYRHVSGPFAVAAGTAVAEEIPIFSKYCCLIISNASGGPATVEAYFSARAFE